MQVENIYYKRVILIVMVICLGIPVFTVNTYSQGKYKNDPILEEVNIKSNKSNPGDWKEIEVAGNITHKNYQHYKFLFREDNLSLIAKLMTLFLIDSEKGYKINEIYRDKEEIRRFSIESLNTIQEGSYIDVHSMNKKEFNFSGKLLVKKVTTFECDVKVYIEYIKRDEDVAYKARVKYTAPAIINGLMSIYSTFTGRDYIAYKLVNFIDNLHLVLHKMDQLDEDSWYELASDKKMLSNLVIPVKFNYQEINLIANMLD